MSRQAAKDWTAREEHLLLNAEPAGETVTLGDAFMRYASEVSPKKRGERWERDPVTPLAQRKICIDHVVCVAPCRLFQMA